MGWCKLKFYETPETCFLCGLQGQPAHHHLIGGPYRAKSDRLGLVVPLCPRCHERVHSDRQTMLYLRRYAQRRMLDAGWTLEQWLAEFGKNYLEE